MHILAVPVEKHMLTVHMQTAAAWNVTHCVRRLPDCPTAFRRPPNCFLKREHALTVPAAWPGAGADAGMGAKAGGCNSDHDFVCNCDCRPSAEAYADSFRPEREHMLVYVCLSTVVS